MPTKQSSKRAESGNLAVAMHKLEGTMKTLPRDYDLFFNPGKHLFFTFLKGIAYGLGVIVAVAIVIPIIVWTLRGIQWVPLVGDFVSKVASQVEEAQHNR